MTKATKLTRFTMAGMMVCSMALTTLTSVSAVAPTITSAVSKDNSRATIPSKVTLKVHKLNFKGEDSSLHTNDGTVNDNYKDVARVDNVEFRLYNIRPLLDSLDKDGKNTEATIKAITEQWNQKKDEWIEQKLVSPPTSQTTKDGGVADFSDVQTKTDGKYNLYLVEEVSGTANTNMFISLPFVVGMPVKTPGKDSYLDTINLYAKNSSSEKELLNKEDGISNDGKAFNFEVGEPIQYSAKVNIPGSINQKNSAGVFQHQFLTISDTMSTLGTTFKQIDSITANGEDVKQLFDDAMGFTNTGNDTDKRASFQYHVDFHDAETDQEALTHLLNKISGKQIQIKYTVVINDKAVPTHDIGNEFKVVFDNRSIVATSDLVETGGYKFTKIDSLEKTHKLAGATFKISRDKLDENGEPVMVDGQVVKEYAVFGNAPTIKDPSGIYKTNDISWDATGTIFETGSVGDNIGNLEFHGLQSGEYQLHEIDAPNGYVKSDDPIPFTIHDGKLGEYQLTATGGLYKEVENTPTDGVLPITGSMGIAAFLIVGTAAMGTAVLIKKRRA